MLPAAPSPVLADAQAAKPESRCADSNLMPTPENVSEVARATICVVNADRARYRLRPLRPNPALAGVALGQAEDMVRGNYFADHSLGGRSPLERIVPALQPARVATAGQNIGWGTGEAETPTGIVRAWMHSAPHRRIILTAAYSQAGVGVVPSLPAVLEAGPAGATYALDVTALR